MSTTSSQIVHHAEYYIPGGDLYILVEEVLFKVHSYFFDRESSRYREEISAPFAPGVARLGSSANPLIIHNTSPQEFSKFLWVFYNKKYSMYKATSTEWIAILKIACEYEFPEVKALAIRGIQKGGNLTICQLIYVYRLYKVDMSYLIPLYIILCKREQAPTQEETKELGLETTLLIFRLREAVRSNSGDGFTSPLPSNLDDDDIMRAICTSLGLDHTIGGSSRKRSPTARPSTTPPPPRSPEGQRRRVNSMQESLNREAFVLDQVVCPPGPEGCRYAEENDVVDQTLVGRAEDRKKALNSTRPGFARGPALSSNLVMAHVKNWTVVAQLNGFLLSVFLVMPVRTTLFFVGVIWTIVVFLVYRAIPSIFRPFLH